jgi:chemotaxis protein methyltransferase CheR
MKALHFENNDREFLLTKESANFLSKIAYDYAGIWIDPSREYYFYHRLLKRIQLLNLPSFEAYCALLEEKGANELDMYINAITTNVTSFFREEIHFEYVASDIIPTLLKKNSLSHQIRIWSAGCSSGEEAYSIAITVAESMPVDSVWNVKILATDINSFVLDVAKIGIYEEEAIDYLTQQQKQHFFLKGTGQNQGKVIVKPELAKMITFNRLNLVTSWPMKSRFDVIFCRNVIIYMNKETQRSLISKFSAFLNPGGYLIIGNAESIIDITNDFKLIKNSVYQKKG